MGILALLPPDRVKTDYRHSLPPWTQHAVGSSAEADVESTPVGQGTAIASIAHKAKEV